VGVTGYTANPFPSQEFSPGDIDPTTGHVITEVDALGNVTRVDLQDGRITRAGVDKLHQYAEEGDRIAFYSELSKYGSKYARLGLDFAKAKSATDLSRVLDEDFSRLVTDLYSKAKIPGYDQIREEFSVQVMREYQRQLELNKGKLLDTKEIIAAHNRALDALGLDRSDWIGNQAVPDVNDYMNNSDIMGNPTGWSDPGRPYRTLGEQIPPPLVLDLNGDGIQIEQLGQSNQFFDTAGDGYQHRTAWADVGDGVLVFDAQNDGVIDQKNEIVFTEWDKTAKSDMQALRDVFDTNQNGKLDSGDAQFSQFKVWVTNADGTRTLQTLTAAGIASINLIENETEITLPDGSKITGQTTYTKTAGGTGTAATVSLATEAQGYALDHTESTVSGVTTIDNKQRNADGSIASETKSVYTSSTKIDVTSFDNDGDAVWDRVQTTDRSVTGTVTITNATAAGVLIDKTQTVVSGLTTTISRNLTGRDYYDQVETQTKAADGSLSITISDKNYDGSLVDKTTRTTTLDSASGEILSRTEIIDRNGDAVTDWTETDNTVINADKSRTDTVIDTAGSGGTAVQVSKTTMVTSSDGQTKTVTADLDGDNDTDLTSVNDITSSTVSGTTTSTTILTDTAGDGTTLIKKTQVNQTASSSGNNQIVTQVDRDGDTKFDLKTDDNTTVSVGYRTQVVQTSANDGTLLGKTTTKRYDDGRTRDIQIDSNGDGKNDQTETITLSAGVSTDTLTDWASDGSMIAQTAKTTTADGLSVTTLIDKDGNTVYETKVTDVTTITAGVSTTETVTITNKDSTLRSSKSVTTTVDGLKITTTQDLNGDTYADLTTKDFTVINSGTPASYQVRTVSDYNKDNSLRDQVVTTTSQNKRNITVQTDLNGDGTFDAVETIVIQDTGTMVDTTSHYAAGALKYQTVVTVTDDKLSTTLKQDWNGDGTFELTTTDVTVFNTDGTRTETISNNAASVLLNKTTISTSANGLAKTTQLDQNGDNTVDVTTSDATVLNVDGSSTRTIQRSNAAGLIDKSVVTTSGNGLSTTSQMDVDGDGTYETVKAEVTAYGLDGTVAQTVTVTNADLSVRSQTRTVVSADQKTKTVTQSRRGSMVQTDQTVEQANGSTVETITNTTPLGLALSSFVITTSANGLSKTVETKDKDGKLVDKQVALTELKDNGDTIVTVTETNGSGGTVSLVKETTSDDGLSITDDITLTGIATLTLHTTDVTSLNNDGSRKEIITSTSSAGIFGTVVTTSDDGLSTTRQTTLNNINYQIAEATTIGLDGSTSESRSEYNTTGSLLWSITKAVDASGRTTTTMVDRDGKSGADWTETVTKNADGSTTDTIIGQSVYGAAAFQKVSTITLNTDGGTTATITDKDGSGVTRDKTTVVQSASGLSTTTQYDINADGKTDLTETDVTVLQIDGGTARFDVARYANGLLASQLVTRTSADGRMVTQTVDNDGNGIAERTYQIVTEADGSKSAIMIDYDNKTGNQKAVSSSKTSANGLVTETTMASGVGKTKATDTTTTFAGANGSYQWVRSVAGSNIGYATHLIDSNGIETWSWSITNQSKWKETTADPIVAASGSIKIDGATKERYIATANAMFQAAFDRDITADEAELLARYISNGDLNRTALANDIVASDEFETKYDTPSAAELINAAYVNAFGYLPSAATRTALGSNSATALIAIAESMLSGQVIRSDVHDGVAWGTVSYANAATGVTANLASTTGDTFYQINNLIGSAFADTLTGDADDNVFVGGAGADKINGGAGNDTVSYGGSAAAVTVNLATNAVSGGDAAGDVISLIENATGSGLADTLTGSAVDNILEGGAGNDTLDGAGGNDTASYADSSQAVNVSLISGATNTGGDAQGDKLSNMENLTGSLYNDTLTGNTANNVLKGGEGDDLLVGGAGADKLAGGFGNDTASYVGSSSGIIADMSKYGAGGKAGDAEGDTYDGIENLVGSANNDILIGTNEENRLEGGNGADMLAGGAGNDVYVFTRGSGHDEVVDTNANSYDTSYKDVTRTVSAGYTYTTYYMHSNRNYDKMIPQTVNASASIQVTDYDIVVTPQGHGDAGRDVLQFGAGISLQDLVFEFRDADLYIALKEAGNPTGKASELSDSIRLANWTDVLDRVETIRFIDGTAADIASLAGTFTPNTYVTKTGTTGADTLTGTTGADLIQGLAGNDALNGAAGNDKLQGGDGNDTLDGGLGNDRLEGGAGNDVYSFARGSGSETIRDESVTPVTKVVDSYNYDPNTYKSTVYYTYNNTSNDPATGSTVVTFTDVGPRKTTATILTESNAGTDTLSFGAGILLGDVVVELAGNDLLVALREAANPNKTFWQLTDRIRIENWADSNDRVEFFKFSDGTVVDISAMVSARGGTSADDTIAGTASADWFSGGVGNDTISGGSGNDILIGGAGNDKLNGEDGDDVITGGGGSDTITGGNGIDWVSYAGSTVAVTVNLTTQTVSGGDATGDTIATIENAQGSDNNDVLTGSGGDNVLKGGLGADTLDGQGGADTADYSDSASAVTVDLSLATAQVSGGTASGDILSNIENLIGSGGNDTLTGSAADNRLDGGTGNDKLTGGAGNDTYIVDGAGDVLSDSSGTDTVIASVNWTLGTAFENLTLVGSTATTGTGNASANIILGNDTDNTLDGGGGADVLKGGLGNDTYLVDNASDSVTELAGQGTDIVKSSVTWTLGAELENLVLTGSSAISGTGNGLDNTLTGNALVNTLSGGGGNDILDGGVGADTLKGGTGDDTYYTDNLSEVIVENAGEGIDTEISSVDEGLDANVENLILTGAAVNGDGNALDNVITGNALDNNLTGGDGNDTLDGGAGNDWMGGGLGDDTYIFDSVDDYVSSTYETGGFDTIKSSITVGLASWGITTVEAVVLTGTANINVDSGNDLDNKITGNSGDNEIYGGNGNDILDGGAGNDYLAGGTGNDTYYADSEDDSVSEDLGEGTDTVYSSADWALTDNIENLILSGSGAYVGVGNDLGNNITGNALDNVLDGGAGNDILQGGAGNDYLIGDLGDDSFYFDSTGDWAAEAEGEGTDTIYSSVTLGLGTWGIDNVENVVLTGTANIDLESGNSLDNKVTGNGGANNIYGGSGNDTLDGGAGDDKLYGGTGNDAYYVDSSNDYALEAAGEGTDTAYSTASDWAMDENVENLVLIGAGLNGYGNSSNNTITGNASDNAITGEDGDDYLDGGAGADWFHGGLGNDTYVFDNAGDWVSQTATPNGGTDTIISSVSFDVSGLGNVANFILTGSANLNITGGNDLANTITGNTGNNQLGGGKGNDTLDGGAGNDVLTGGAGNDTLTGGSGTADIAMFAGSQASYTISTSAGVVTITDTDKTTDGDDGTDKLTGVEIAQFKGGAQVNIAAPIVLDLDGDGVELTDRGSNSAAIDLDGDGVADKTGWIGSGDGFLVIDRNGDGTFSDASELSFVNDKLGAKSDLDGLSAYDSNDDGLISSLDQNYAKFMIWQDANGNGIADTGESKSLTERGIASIGLAGVATNKTWDWNDSVVINTGTFHRTDGTTGSLADVAFLYEGSAEVAPEEGGTQSNGSASGQLLVGEEGNDDLAGGSGNDTLVGGNGSDTFRFGRGGGSDVIIAYDTDADSDTLKLGAGVSADQLWFRQVNGDLDIGVVGTADHVTVRGWGGSADYQLDRIELADGSSAGVQDIANLVSAMSAFNPPTLGQTSLDQARAAALSPVLAASWHSS
jgi:Ca2+-binding RTX toxin-like protein